jgi:hypothetical protein
MRFKQGAHRMSSGFSGMRLNTAGLAGLDNVYSVRHKKSYYAFKR